jgi:hypothetical protein
MSEHTDPVKIAWDDDEAVLAELAVALRPAAGLVEEVAAQGRGIYALRTLDDDLLLAELSFDSRRHGLGALRGAPEVTGNRSDSGDTTPRVMVFEAAPLAVELEVEADRVVGQIVPAGPGQVFIETAVATIQVEADELGFFVLPPLPPGPVRLRCDTDTGRLRTGWFQL